MVEALKRKTAGEPSFISPSTVQEPPMCCIVRMIPPVCEWGIVHWISLGPEEKVVHR